MWSVWYNLFDAHFPINNTNMVGFLIWTVRKLIVILLLFQDSHIDMVHSVIFKPDQESKMADDNDFPYQDGSVYHDLDSQESTEIQGSGSLQLENIESPKKMVEIKGKCPHCPYTSKRSDYLQSHIAKLHNQDGEIPAPKKRGRKPRGSLPEASVTTVNEEKSGKLGRKSLPEPLVTDEKADRKGLSDESTSNMGEKLKSGKRGRKSKATLMAETIQSSDVETPIRKVRKSLDPNQDSTEIESENVATKRGRKSAGPKFPVGEEEDQPLKRGQKRLSNDNNIVQGSPDNNKRMKEEDMEVQTKEVLDESVMLNRNLLLGKEIQELSYRNIELETRLITLAGDKERAEKESSILKHELSIFKDESQSKFQELDNAKDHIEKMSKLFSSKNAELSSLRLNEERLILDNRKLEKLAKSREEKFSLLKSTLTEVLKDDDKFCKNALGNMPTSNDDNDICDAINIMIVDYVASKKRHLADIQKSNDNLKVVQDKKDFYKKTIR